MSPGQISCTPPYKTPASDVKERNGAKRSEARERSKPLICQFCLIHYFSNFCHCYEFLEIFESMSDYFLSLYKNGQ